MKKRVLSIFVTLLLSLSLFACDGNSRKQEASDGTESISSEKNLLDVEVTLPASLVDNEDIELDDEAKESGIKEIIKNDDGSVTLKMTKSGHEKLLDEMKSNIDDSIEKILSDDETYPSIDSITYNKDVTEFNVKADSSIYTDLESLCSLQFYLFGSFYQALNAVSEDDIKVVVNFIDKDTGEIIESCDSSSLNDFENEEKPTEEQTNQTEQIDMSGDYIGNIPCPLPPLDSVYKICRLDDYNSSIVIYIENIDDCNFQFHIAEAIYNNDGSVSENTIFLEHIAHYNGSGYYEYIGTDYHLYFKYNDLGNVSSYKVIEIYGLEKLFNPNDYNETMQYNGMTGNLFRQGYPGAS